MQPNLVTAPPRRTETAGPTVFPYGQSDGSSPWPETPGAADCPDCGTTPIDGQGVLDCPDCEWTGRADAL